MQTQCWNTDWKFWEERNAFALVWDVPEQARTITLPHDAMLEKAAVPDSPNGGNTGYRNGGNYVYVKQLYAPEEYRNQTVQLKFEGVYMNALVYVNGQLAAQHPYGYTQFCAPLNDYLQYGQSNEIRVLVKNSASPNSRWYTGSGIYRDVWLQTGGLIHIPDSGLHVVTRWADREQANLTVSVTLANRSHAASEITVETELLDPSGRPAASAAFPVALAAGRVETIDQDLCVSDPALWSAQTPELYRCVVRLRCGETTLDEAQTAFGIRTMQLDSRHGLRVNGTSVKLRGACIHHDNGLLGAVTSDQVELRRVRILKQAGFNAIRMSHNPAGEALLRACDTLGMYVMDEAFDMWSRPKSDCDYSLFSGKWWRDDVEALVRKDRNHPSVIFYSLGNEIPEVGTPQGSALGRDMARLIKAMDPERFVMVSVNGVFASGDRIGQIMADVLASSPADDAIQGNVNDFMAVMDAKMDDIVVHPIVSSRLEHAAAGMDLLGYNYMTSRYLGDASAYPQRVMVGSETYPPQIVRNWPLVERLPSLVGDFTWTGWDYIGEAGVGIPAYQFGEGGFGAQYPCQLAYCGDIDITGFRRPASYLREIVFGLRQAPYITVQDPAHYGQALRKTPWVISDSCSTWNWTGWEGKRVIVEIYSPGTQVELFQDGVSLGRKPAGEAAGYTALFETVYRPGKLLAVSYDEDRETGRMELTSAGAPSGLRLEAEPAPDGAGHPLRYVHIAVCDAEGQVVTDQDTQITVRISGGALAGLGSADPKPAFNYTGYTTRTHHGRALAIVRCESARDIAVQVSADGLPDAQLTLTL